MFGIGMPEMILILAVALIVIGPKKLPDLAKSLGRAMGEFKKATSDLKQSMEADTGISEVKETIDDINKDIKQSVNFDNIEDYKPEPEKPIETDQNKTGSGQFEERKETSEAMGDLKNAFDELNSDDADAASSDEAVQKPEDPVTDNTDEGVKQDGRG